MEFTSTASLSSTSSPVSRYFYIKVIDWVAELVVSKKSTNIDTGALSVLLKGFTINVIKHGHLSRVITKEDNAAGCIHSIQNMWGHIVSGYLQSLWLSLIHI